MTEDKKNKENQSSTDSTNHKPDLQPGDQKGQGEQTGVKPDSSKKAEAKTASQLQSGQKVEITPSLEEGKDSVSSKTPESPSKEGKDSVSPETPSKERKDSVSSKTPESPPKEGKDTVSPETPESPSKERKDSASPETPESSSEEVKKEENISQAVKLQGLFAFKQSMTTFYNEKGESVPVTALKYEPGYISQIKTQEKESYNAVQVAFQAQKNKRCSKALIVHLTPAGFKEGARFVREIRQEISEGTQIGQKLSIESLKKGDVVKISSLSKGRGFSGVMKKWNFGGGRASHGSKSHRRIGSIGQHTEPAKVMPGRKMPGQYGNKKVSRSKVPVVEVLPEEGMIFVKGPVPGARNSLVSLVKM